MERPSRFSNMAHTACPRIRCSWWLEALPRRNSSSHRAAKRRRRRGPTETTLSLNWSPNASACVLARSSSRTVRPARFMPAAVRRKASLTTSASPPMMMM
eukprot:8681148-Lingulodinium_polyedra.AAC.1